jgi:two-component system, cell cycle response regulator
MTFGWRVFWQRLFAPRDRELADAGVEGELLVARARLALTALILIVPLTVIIEGPVQPENWLGLFAAAFTVVLSIAVLTAVSRGWRPRWLGLATSLFDVTIISCVLASFLVIGPPHMAVNSRTTFEVYFLALGATCLRYDQRICFIAGLVATAQYGCIVWFAAHHWDLNASVFAPYPYGYFSVSGEVGRLILMLGATLLSATIVNRNERLRVLSTHDPLTGLYNRAYFVERLNEELSRAARYEHPLAVVIIDLDHFKNVNDEWGHDAGDAVLLSVAHLFRDHVRRTDIVARYGGEEFALIFPETTGEAAIATLEHVRAHLRASPIEIPKVAEKIRLTFSGGVAFTPGDGYRVEDLINCADLRLMVAKKSGRDRVIGASATVAV